MMPRMTPHCDSRKSARMAMLSAVAIAAAMLGCADSEEVEVGDVRIQPAPERTIVQPVWETVFQVGGSLEDTLLLQPGRMAADDRGISVVDFHAGRLMRFNRVGELVWSFGRKGQGPDEISHPRDLKLDGRGRSWILDVENARILVLSPDGHADRRIPLDQLGYRPDDFVPFETSDAVLLTYDTGRPLVRVDTLGTVLSRSPFPFTGFADLNLLSSQLTTGSDPQSDRWVAAFNFGGFFFSFEGDRLVGQHPFVEPVDFPQVIQERSGGPFGRSQTTTMLADPVFAALSVTLSEHRTYVLFAGSTEYQRRIIDSYALPSGDYVESFLLPRRVSDISVGGGILYVRYSDPFPTLAAWRPKERELP